MKYGKALHMSGEGEQVGYDKGFWIWQLVVDKVIN